MMTLLLDFDVATQWLNNGAKSPDLIVAIADLVRGGGQGRRARQQEASAFFPEAFATLSRCLFALIAVLLCVSFTVAEEFKALFLKVDVAKKTMTLKEVPRDGIPGGDPNARAPAAASDSGFAGRIPTINRFATNRSAASSPSDAPSSFRTCNGHCGATFKPSLRRRWATHSRTPSPTFRHRDSGETRTRFASPHRTAP
ncbi:MAG: hypothetical protein FJ303_26565 [Planctomycetes bacterium]|nr:hypothetical protein [Planctomycetota bacterium]